MNMQKPLKCAAAAISAILVYTSASGAVTAETSLGGTEADALVTASSEASEQLTSESESEKTEWWKAEITDYDSSLSLISYEITPEITQTENDETDETGSVNTPEKTDNNNSSQKSPTPVESQTTGAAVGEIPQAQATPEINAQSGEFAFTTYGWGHGVGLSQNGANFYAM